MLEYVLEYILWRPHADNIFSGVLMLHDTCRVVILLPHTAIGVCILVYMSPRSAGVLLLSMCVLILLHVSSYCYMCSHTATCVLILLFMCAHTAGVAV